MHSSVGYHIIQYTYTYTDRADDFLAVPELAVNPLLDRIVAVFGNGCVMDRP